MEPRSQKAFEFASNSVKQLITLSTGIVALTITFAKDILHGVSLGPRALLIGAWLVYLLSITFGVWTLLALTGSLEPEGADPQNWPRASIRGKNVKIPSVLQVLSFLLGTLLTVAFGIWAAVM